MLEKQEIQMPGREAVALVHRAYEAAVRSGTEGQLTAFPPPPQTP